MGSSLPQLWAANETKPRLIAIALNIPPLPGAMVTFSYCGGDYYRGICSTKGNVFFKIVVSRMGVFITLCILVVPEGLSGRQGFHRTRFCTNMVGKKGFCAADWGFFETWL